MKFMKRPLTQTAASRVLLVCAKRSVKEGRVDRRPSAKRPEGLRALLHPSIVTPPSFFEESWRKNCARLRSIDGEKINVRQPTCLANNFRQLGRVKVQRARPFGLKITVARPLVRCLQLPPRGKFRWGQSVCPGTLERRIVLQDRVCAQNEWKNR